MIMRKKRVLSNMDILSKIQLKVQSKVKTLKFEVQYLPGEDSESDSYRAFHDKLKVSCYGPTKDEAIASAKMEAEAILMGKPSLIENL